MAGAHHSEAADPKMPLTGPSGRETPIARLPRTIGGILCEGLSALRKQRMCNGPLFRKVSPGWLDPCMAAQTSLVILGIWTRNGLSRATCQSLNLNLVLTSKNETAALAEFSRWNSGSSNPNPRMPVRREKREAPHEATGILQSPTRKNRRQHISCFLSPQGALEWNQEQLDPVTGIHRSK